MFSMMKDCLVISICSFLFLLMIPILTIWEPARTNFLNRLNKDIRKKISESKLFRF